MVNLLTEFNTNKKVSIVEKTTRVNMSIDAGSTGTRIHQWDNNPATGKVYEIEAEYSEVQTDISHIASASDNLYDNLEVVLTDLTDSKANKVFETAHIAKGGLFKDLGIKAKRTSSMTPKSEQDTTFINALCAIGIRAYIFAYENGGIAEDIYPALTIALPQEDIASKKRQEEFKDKLAGVYEFKLPRVNNFSVRIHIAQEDVLLMDEAQAALGYWRMANKIKQDQYKGVLLLDAGGRSVDLSLLIDGRFKANGFRTCKTGGQNFINLIIGSYVNETGNAEPSIQMVRDALDTGLLQDGNSLVDITKYIAMEKKTIADIIVNDIDNLMDKAEIPFNQLNLVICTGKLMGETKNENSHVDSLSANIATAIKARSKNTEIGRIDNEYALVCGLSMARFVYNSKKK